MARTVETGEFGAFAGRIVRAMARRAVGDGDLSMLAELVALRAAVDQALADAAPALNDAGHSWADIGAMLGTTRQRAHVKYARRQPA